MVDMKVRQTETGCSYGIFHERLRKIMALTPLKARAGIAALTFAAVVPLPAVADAFFFSTGSPEH
jgi:hypothetical protein